MAIEYTLDEYTEGWTAPIKYNLYHKDPETGELSSFDASEMTPAVVLKMPHWRRHNRADKILQQGYTAAHARLER